MLRHIYKALTGLLIFSVALGLNVSPAVRAQIQNLANLRQFDFLNETSGWVLFDRQIFWTNDASDTWRDVTPALPDEAAIQAVDFNDINLGWVLWVAPASDGSSHFQLAQTSDQGASWTTNSLTLFEDGEPGALAEKAQMGWLDSQTGWISIKQASGSNFSLGTLFTTSDGGVTWAQSVLPVADQVHFDGPSRGWAVGGPAGDQVFETQDGGRTWREISPAHPATEQVMTYVPFYANGQGLLVTTQLAVENFLNVYAYTGTGWSLLEQVRLSTQPGTIGLSMLDAENFVAAISGTPTLIHFEDGALKILRNTDGNAESIVELDMLTLKVGWARVVIAECSSASNSDPKTVSVFCSSATRLLRTRDGGVTWQAVTLPVVESSSMSSESTEAPGMVERATAETLADLVNSQSVIGQGFDKCELPTVSQLQTWWNSSPYQSVNLYIGGANRGCDNLALSAEHLKTIHQQGWKFIPTWVGPQAPCTGYLTRMSNDPATAYNQGVAEADLAVAKLAELGLTYPNQTGSVVYYDMENYGTGSTCRTAVNSFMNGWVARLHELGNLAGVYGSTLCNTGLSDFLNIPNVPDLIWPARWYHNQGEGFYDPDASVWDLGSCIPNTVWADHQRIRQYEGDHDETWGNLTLGIDSNVLDGVVAVPYLLPYIKSVIPEKPDLANLANVVFTVRFSSQVTGVDLSDFVLTTSAVTGASITNVTGSGKTYSVTVATGTGNGTLRLDVVDDDSIVDAIAVPLGGAGLGNGNFSEGGIYTKPLVFTSIGTDDGWILESTETSKIGGSLGATGGMLRLGDSALNQQYRAILSFDLSELPDGAVITAVTLRLKHAGIGGTDPFSTHGNLIVDVCNGPYLGDPLLTLEDFNAACIKNKVIVFTNTKVNKWYSRALLSDHFQYLNLGGVTQFRLRFNIDDNNDFEADFLKLHSGNALNPANHPQLIIEYYIP